jgi:membrane protein implicated in regulation of membrane protease activity
MSWWLWTILGILAIVVEVNATRDFSLFCVGLSAMFVAALAGFDVVDVAWAQWICFSAIAIALLFLLRTPLQRWVSPRDTPVKKMDYLVGEVAQPIEDIPVEGFGKAELRGTTWTARNDAGAVLVKGQRCRVTKVDGLTIWVTAEQSRRD